MLKIRHPLPFSVVAGAAWLLCAAQAASGVGGDLVLCPFRLLTGHRCPGCGMGHAVVAAMRGDWAGSFHLHPLGIPLLAVWTAWLAAEAVRAARSGASARSVL
ncbi:MAG: DUF2752 domain-containing protein [Elusimicrobia bacterium]|nr:DUF2752 domain-containing protein [Elusimicrobiota bacterium]